MRSLFGVLPFIALTFLCWGNYGPLMHEGVHGKYGMHGSLRPFICVGLAYFLIAVVIPTVVLWKRGEDGQWTMSGTFWSLSAGVAGAIGALGIVMALKFKGETVYVMPLVFGLAPVVNTFVTMFMARTYKEASPIFFGGVAVVALGAAGVLIFKPGSEEVSIANLTIFQFTMILISIATTAICWGSYGPVLHKGQMKMKGSRLRPFMCVGIAYFAIAVVVPLIVLGAFQNLETESQWTIGGIAWSLAAGAVGAVGALGIILAFNFGGKPIFVMPLVFGIAPVVNTFTTIVTKGVYKQITWPFYLTLGMVIVGAITVLVFAPKHAKASPPEEISNTNEMIVEETDTPETPPEEKSDDIDSSAESDLQD